MAEKKKYKVRRGYRFGINDEVEAGGVVELTDAEAIPVIHKLEAVASGPESTDTNPNPDSLERVFGEQLEAKLKAAGITQVAEVRVATDREILKIVTKDELAQIKNALDSSGEKTSTKD